ncbi:MAG: extracellular solute-binding protein [Oscillibacter sp.]|nr:extracellular solute-binding protein [Oscillibacter sp.]
MKKFLAALLALVMVLALAGCGGGGSDSGTTPPSGSGDAAPAGTGEKIDINVVAAQYGQNTTQWWADFQDAFNAEYENINLTVEVISWNDIATVVNTRVSNNQAPDILNIDVFAAYQDDGLLLPAEEYVSAETYAKFYPAFLEQSEVDGTIWAIPDLASARALYYNQDILTAAGVEVPTTWEELEAACAAIKAYNPDIYPWGIDMTTDEGQAAFAYYIWNNGGDFTDADGNWTLNSPENVEAIEYAIGLVEKGYTNTDPANETRYTLQDLFGAGQLAMMIGPNSIPTYVKTNGFEVNYATAPIPTNGGKESVSAGVMDRFMCFDNGHSPEKIEAIKTFFDYFYEDQRYSDWVLMEDFLPATSSGGEIVAAADERMAAWVDIVGSCKFYPTAKAEWDDVKQGVISVEQNALLGGNVQELLDALQSQIAG